MNHPASERPELAEDTSTRNRILAATAEVLGRHGQTKLSLSEVALQVDGGDEEGLDGRVELEEEAVPAHRVE